MQVATWLRDRERLAQVGGMAYLTEVLNAAPAVANVVSYAKTIHEKFRVRQLILACQRVTAQGYAGYGEAQVFIDSAEQAVYDIARTRESTSIFPLRDVMQETFRRMMKATERGARIIGIPTGFDRYDRITSGLHDGELTIVAARPGMGKTSLVLNMAINVASPQELESARDPNDRWQEPGYAVVIFSLEMPRQQIVNRMLSSEARIDGSRVRTGMLAPSDWSKLTQAAAHLNTLNVWVDDSGDPVDPRASLEGPSPAVRVRPDRPGDRREEAARRPRDGRLPAADEGARERELARARDQRDLARLEAAGEGAQSARHRRSVSSNRAVETRGEKSKRPQLSDLRESGAIEQDADNICFIYRDEYYNKESTERNIAELIVAKQRKRSDRHREGQVRRAVHALRGPP